MKLALFNESGYELDHFEYASEPSNRAATMASSEAIESIQHLTYRSGTSSLQFLDKIYSFRYLGAAFKKSSPFLKVFNEILGRLESNGLAENIRQSYSYSTTKIEEIGPQVLKMDHLKLGFLACCIPMVLAAIVFICEFAWSRLVTFSRKNSIDSKKHDRKVNCDAEISSEFRRTQLEEENVESGELIEMHGIAVAETHQEDFIDFTELIKSYNSDDLVQAYQEHQVEIGDSKAPNNKGNWNAMIFESEFRQTQPQKRNNGPQELIEMHDILVEKIHQEVRVDWVDLIDDSTAEVGNITTFDKLDKSQKIPQNVRDDIDDLVEKCDFRSFTKSNLK